PSRHERAIIGRRLPSRGGKPMAHEREPQRGANVRDTSDGEPRAEPTPMAGLGGALAPGLLQRQLARPALPRHAAPARGGAASDEGGAASDGAEHETKEADYSVGVGDDDAVFKKVAVANSWLVSAPGRYRETLVDKLAVDERVQLLDTGASETFNNVKSSKN